MQNSSRTSPFLQPLAIIGVAVLCALLPLLDFTTIDLLIVFATYTALGVSWNWVGGFAGLLNLAHVAYYAIGAYACAIAVAVLGLHPLFGMVAGMAVAAGLALAISLLSFKLKVTDLYYALLTLTLAEALAAVARGLENVYSLGGLYLPFRNEPAQLAFLDKVWYYYMLIALAAILMLVQYGTQRSKWGLLVIGARDSERAASSLGVPVARVMTSVSVASAVPAALVGSIFALTSLYVTVDSVFTFELLLSIIIAVTIGGIGTLWGPLVGAMTITIVQEVIRRFLGSSLEIVGLTDIVYGVMLIAIIVLVPVGAVGVLRRVIGRKSRAEVLE